MTHPVKTPDAPTRQRQLQAVTPHLVCAGAADAIEFYRKAFGAVEMTRLKGKDGKLMHAAVKIGDASIMLVDECRVGEHYKPNRFTARP